ncbi:hypothetical protein METBIDRAFT_43192 [Metschnikowia bicuspidata var. bicuspidata NRRL YB-4993]|uniref:dynamin GTPase n=1 Tax=Metschnikowia bicuspidata var. bicuspidata NRRL YB-4993 TaxID=869754 RepID=A0A1A0H9H1_9ASCO|nr:hypothetical protein METBIDRAFT_43192 [Metschnikowia bicuspidata var. bicuspidata NRRL YB-4993]OBA20523.1 hypothetical protein METBIDRAFT_43192 [Metschnikowia bicuspidata var. bicuspidata NRRL YB-4993]
MVGTSRNLSLLSIRPGLSSITRGSKVNLLVAHRNIGFIKILARSAKIPGYIGGSIAAGGTYVAYKVEQASSYTSDKITSLKDYTADIFDQTGQFLKGSSTTGDGGSSSSSSSGGGNGTGNDTAAVGATAAAMGLSTEENDTAVEDEDEFDEEDEETLIDQSEEDSLDLSNDETADDMLNLTRQMIEIRNILTRVDSDSETMKLPSIVVVGSQSSGKSSVLESIVGHEFLPKGNNMVTRRPIELTLVNSPESACETAEFPALKIFNVTDFEQVQRTLFDLNMAVPASECVSNDPIQITIRSPKVPDLTLVDLPGYIQIEASDQPTELKQKIRGLCNRYLEAPNIILAISAADVDLANSSALRAAKLADPRGERTLGVITKIDLVDPEKARGILLNRKYPLKMGYVGVITRAPSSAKASSTSLFSRKQITGFQAYVAQQNFEFNFFKERREDFTGTVTGSRNLKKKLMKVLEKSMSASLRPTHLAIQRELEETAYKFKVEFNDRPLTPQMYLANNIDMLKLGIKELSQNFSRGELKSLLKNELDQKVLDILAERYWNKFSGFSSKESQYASNDPNLRELSQLSSVEDDSYWHKKLDLASNSLTKLGVGRLSTSLVSDAMVTEINNLVENTQLANHPMARQAVEDSAKAVLKAKFYFTADQVENCIKPYKYEVEIEDREWASSKDNAVELLREEMRQCDHVQSSLKKQIGGRKLLQVMRYLEKLKSFKKSDELVDSREALGFSKGLIETGQYALFLQERMKLLKMRYQFVKNSKKCKSKDNKYQCPEIFLDAVSTKLTSTAILFLNVELLSDFYYNFPRKLDDEFFNNMSRDQLESFAKEDPKVRKHIELQERKDLLETALSKIEGVLAIRGHKEESQTSGKWW